MNLRYPHLGCIRLTLLTAALVLSAPGAHAFTIDNSSLNSDGSPKYTDRDAEAQGFADRRTIRPFGPGRLQFGVSPSNEAGMNRFYPIPGEDSLTGGR
jgi:hypothetical protein